MFIGWIIEERERKDRESNRAVDVVNFFLEN